MSKKTQLEEGIKEIIKAISQSPEVLDEMTFNDLGIDSLGIIRMFVEIEERWGISFEDEAIEINMYSTIKEFLKLFSKEKVS